jgi:hypothetical protein
MITFGNFLCGGGQLPQEGFRRLSNDTFFLSNAVYQTDPNKIIFLNTNQGEFTIKFPDVVESGDIIYLVDIGGNLETEPVRLINLNRSGGEIVDTFLLNIPNSFYKFYFVSPEFGWLYERTNVNTIGGITVADVIWSEILSKPNTLSGYGIADAYTKSEVNSLIPTSFAWAAIINKPTTLNGYGITDAYTKSEVNALVTGGSVDLTWGSITNTPSTLSGYGITDSYTKTEANTLFSGGSATPSWSVITNKPTTLAGYGITDAVKRYSSYTATTNQSIAAFDSVFVNIDNITLTLPQNPVYGDEITIFNGNSITTQINGNGKLISGNVNNLVVDVKNIGIRLVYMDANGGNWMIH